MNKQLLTSLSFGGSQGGSEKAMTTHSSTLAWRIPWTETPGRLQSMGRKEVHMTEATQQQQLLFKPSSTWPTILLLKFSGYKAIERDVI